MATSVSRTIPIGGVRVQFPYKPYPSQLSMMAKIIAGVEKQQSCLLESPTGTGKSLALLCSVLAWQQAHKEKLDKEASEKLKSLPDELDPSRMCSCKCHFGMVKQEPAEHTEMEPSTSNQPDMSSKEDVGSTSVKDESMDFGDDDDDFKPAQRSFRTPKNRRRSHLTITYEEQNKKVEEESNETKWKMEITSAEGQKFSETLKENITEAEDCEKCQCAEAVKWYMEHEGEKIRYPKIYYGTRTHRQLSQITKELARTGYKHTKMTLLAAKRHTCVHPAVSKSKDVNEGCKQLLDGPGCRQNEKSRTISQSAIEQAGLDVAWDLEDLIGLCKENSACPYFAARELRTGADIIFCPYNYLIDPNIRSSMEIDLKGDVIILDEAHNVEDSARSAASYLFNDKQLAGVMAEMDMLVQGNKHIPDHLAMKKLCQDTLDVIEDTKNSMTHTDFDTTSKHYSGNEIVILLQRMGCGADKLNKLKSHLSNCLDENDDQRQAATNKKTPLKMSNASSSLFKGLFQVLEYIYQDNNKYLDDYRLAVTRETSYSTVEGTNTWLNSRKSRKNVSHIYTLHLWCLNPAVAFSDLGVARSVVLTSGTLAPIQTFQSELGLPFPIQLEANHVIDSNQVWVGVVGRGPRNKPLLASYQNSETLDFQDEVGRVILDVCKTVPHGILCFLSSYKMLEKLKSRWIDTGLWQQLHEVKGVYAEPRGSDPNSFEEVIQDFYNSVKASESEEVGAGRGGLLFAVCRGKLSEGIDFSNNKARAVLVIGIPYPNVKDTLVNLKREYNNRHHLKRGLLSGSQWYEIQAFRALNQALGRCIRHRHDWGALILMDERFSKSEKYTKGLSKWLRSRVQHFSNYTDAQDSLQCFAEYRKNGGSPSRTLDTSCVSECHDVSLHSPVIAQTSTPKPRSSTLTRKLIDKSIITPIKPSQEATEHSSDLTNDASETSSPIKPKPIDNDVIEENATLKCDIVKNDSRASSPLLFESESASPPVEVAGADLNVDNIGVGNDKVNANIRQTAKKSESLIFEKSDDFDIHQTKRKESEESAGIKELKIKRSKRRKVFCEEQEIEVVDDIVCPTCEAPLVSRDKAHQVERNECPAFIEDIFRRRNQAYRIDKLYPNTIECLEGGDRAEPLNAFYSEDDGCCVRLFVCRSCSEDVERDHQIPCPLIGFQVKLTDGSCTSLAKDQIWLVL